MPTTAETTECASPACSVRFSLAPREALAASLRLMRRPEKFASVLLFAVFLRLGFATTPVNFSELTGMAALVFEALLLAAVLFLLHTLLSASGLWRRSPVELEATVWPDGVSLADLARRTLRDFRWVDLQSCEDLGRFILLTPRDEPGIVIPRRAFATPESAQVFIAKIDKAIVATGFPPTT